MPKIEQLVTSRAWNGQEHRLLTTILPGLRGGEAPLGLSGKVPLLEEHIGN